MIPLSDNYFLSNLLIIGILLAVYHVWLRSSQNLLFNRFYLLLACTYAAVIPLISLEVLPVYVPYEQLRLTSGEVSSEVTLSSTSPISIWNRIYWIVTFLCLAASILRVGLTWLTMRKLDGLSRSSQYVGEPMSFFHYQAIPIDADNVVIAHEHYHSLALHSLDRIYLDFLHSIFWYNPFYFIVKRYLLLNHEYAADRYSIKENHLSHLEYGKFLLEHVQTKSALQLMQTNSFTSSIKHRIDMLHQSAPSHPLTYVIILALAGILFCSFTFRQYYVVLPSDIENRTGLDTLPSHVSIIDTIIMFDTESMEERRSIVSTRIDQSNVLDHIDRIQYSGKLIEARDTIIVFDTETMKETTSIVTYSYPMELSYLLQANYGIPQNVLIDRAIAAMKK